MVQVKKLADINGHKSVYVITPMHPNVQTEINLVGVAKMARQHVGNQLKKWLKKKVLYIKQ